MIYKVYETKDKTTELATIDTPMDLWPDRGILIGGDEYYIRSIVYDPQISAAGETKLYVVAKPDV